MLARPEFNTREDILLWLGSKPRKEKYYWGDPCACACGQYAKARGKFVERGAMNHWMHHGGLINRLNGLAWRAAVHIPQNGCGTFGALYDLAEKEL